MFGKKVSKILKLPSVRSCFTLAMTNKLVVIINSLEVPKIIKKKSSVWNEISCTKLQLPPEPLTRGLPPPDPRSLCPLSSTEFVEPLPEKNSCVRVKFTQDEVTNAQIRSRGYSPTVSLTWALHGCALSTSLSGRFTPGKESLYPLHWRLNGPPGPVWAGAENLAPPGFDSRTVQSVASRYTGYAIAAHRVYKV